MYRLKCTRKQVITNLPYAHTPLNPHTNQCMNQRTIIAAFPKANEGEMDMQAMIVL